MLDDVIASVLPFFSTEMQILQNCNQQLVVELQLYNQF